MPPNSPHQPNATPRSRRLPHQQVENGRYFITLCQHGALPAKVVANIRQQSRLLATLKGGPLLDQKRKIFQEIERWLDQHDAKGDLIEPAVAQMLLDAIDQRHATAHWQLHAAVIMRNHIHLFVDSLQSDLFTTMIEFKRWTARQANRLLNRKGQFWQREWYDHWSRTQAEDKRIIAYIQNNPTKAHLCQHPHQYPHRRPTP